MNLENICLKLECRCSLIFTYYLKLYQGVHSVCKGLVVVLVLANLHLHLHLCFRFSLGLDLISSFFDEGVYFFLVQTALGKGPRSLLRRLPDAAPYS